MSLFATSFETISDLLGGREAVQRLLNVGASALSNYLKRESIPETKMAILREALAQKGWVLEPDSLNCRPADQDNPPVILLIITGGIAAYKALEVARRLGDRGARVRGVMTKGATNFITPLSLAALTAEKVYTDLFDLTDESEMGHIRLAREADLVLVVPASAHFIAKLAHGLCDDLASTLCLASTAPLMVAPAMNPAMWAHPATQDNLALLRTRGVYFAGPEAGDTACGEIGTGRLLDPGLIVQAAMGLVQHNPPAHDLVGCHILVTAGPTHEDIDAVRFIGNHSSGRQGYAIAAACAMRGAEVSLISGPTNLDCPHGVKRIKVRSAEEMQAACIKMLPADIAICCAAVADWRVAEKSEKKIKKQDNASPPVLKLVENPDILAGLCQNENRPQLVVGFAAETGDVLEKAAAKRLRKGCDWIFANDVYQENGSVFGAQTNELIWISDKDSQHWPNMEKEAIATKIAEELVQWHKTG